MSKSDPSVTIQLDDGEGRLVPEELRPTLRAQRNLNSYFGNLLAAKQAVLYCNFDAICYAIGEGLSVDRKNKRAERELQERVYETGAVTLTDDIARYLELVWRGGKAEAEEDEGVAEPGAEEPGAGRPKRRGGKAAEGNLH